MGVAYGAGRQALLEAAIHVVSRKGLRGLTYRSVAAEAGVTHGSVAYHFGDRDTLIREALVLSASKSIDDIVLTSDGPDFDGFARGLVDMVTTDPDLQVFQYELSLEARRRPELRGILAEVNDIYRAAVGRELRRNGLDDPHLTHVVFVLLDGLVFHETVTGDHERTRRSLETVRDLLRAYAARVGA